MRYRLNDRIPDVMWIYNDNLSGALVTATYTKPDYTTVSRLCALSFSTINDKIQTTITHEWRDGDLDQIGLGKLQLKYVDSEGHIGSIPPVNGFQVIVDP